jgi:hypothetical protein
VCEEEGRKGGKEIEINPDEWNNINGVVGANPRKRLFCQSSPWSFKVQMPNLSG